MKPTYMEIPSLIWEILSNKQRKPFKSTWGTYHEGNKRYRKLQCCERGWLSGDAMAEEYVARVTECKQENSTLQITKANLQKEISCPCLAQRPVPTEHLAGSSATQTTWMLKSRGSINCRPSRGRGRQNWSRNAAESSSSARTWRPATSCKRKLRSSAVLPTGVLSSGVWKRTAQ
ncbi:uncharacterized protein [Anser cygnoides]|uniref:uncharacterized protein isoform X1 n=1 Tax=Anser cygnoides TaxID=8845 RepID=UPI0034D16C5B